jgi:hypothetical protein
VWTGSVSGNMLSGRQDELWNSVLEFCLQSQPIFNDFDRYLSAASFYWSSLVFAIILAFLTAAKKIDRWWLLLKYFPRLGGFLNDGYHLDWLVLQIMFGLTSCSSWLAFFDYQLGSRWIPEGAAQGANFIGTYLAKLDKLITTHLGDPLNRFMRVAGKLLQLVQAGDIRWYLACGLGSGFALLAHYWKILKEMP